MSNVDKDNRPVPNEEFMIPKPELVGDYTDPVFKQKGLLYELANGRFARWSNTTPLPNIGDWVKIIMNKIGPGEVVGYFAAWGGGEDPETNWYVGVMTKALKPPAWLKKQQKESAGMMDKPQWYRDGVGCEFGMEVKL